MASLAECTIRKAEFDDIENIMKFIERYWNPNHILCKSRKFFEWQHYYHGEVCFIIAENNCRHEIEGIVGIYRTLKKKNWTCWERFGKYGITIIRCRD